MSLPSDLESDIVKYLRLELGDSEDDPTAIKKRDLKYVGVKKSGRAETHF